MTPQEQLRRRQVLRARVEIMLEAVESMQRELAELDAAAGKKPQGRRRRGLRVIDGGKS